MEAFIEKFSRKYNLPAADCLRLIGLMERRVFRKGECVVRQGERNSGFYVVSRGIWLGHYLDDGADVSVWFAGEGEALFSTWGYVGNEVSKISIEAMCDAELYGISKADLEAFFARSAGAANFMQDVDAGRVILIDDGLIELKVVGKSEKEIFCEVINGGELGERKGVNVPNVAVRLPAITEKDKDDIRFGVEQGIDFIAASFVRNAECVLEIKAYLKELGAPYVPIIAKVENAEGIKNIDEIIRAADGVMVARGDLGVEIPAEEVPYLQKMIIQKCNMNFKTVITATQMLDSMMRNPRPTRAEVTDVANAVYDGTDAVMLSGETAQGKYPLEALQMMVHIIQNTEQHLDYEGMLEKTGGHLKSGVSSAIGYSSVLAASNLNAKCIITPSVSGATARVVSNLRPRQVILGVTPNERTLRRMSIYWGVKPIKSQAFNTTDDICDGAIELAKVKQFVETGEIVVITAGIPSPNVKKERSATSNMMRIATVE